MRACVCVCVYVRWTGWLEQQWLRNPEYFTLSDQLSMWSSHTFCCPPGESFGCFLSFNQGIRLPQATTYCVQSAQLLAACMSFCQRQQMLILLCLNIFPHHIIYALTSSIAAFHIVYLLPQKGMLMNTMLKNVLCSRMFPEAPSVKLTIRFWQWSPILVVVYLPSFWDSLCSLTFFLSKSLTEAPYSLLSHYIMFISYT